ncbi:MAG: single-stranded DNA-binding protein [Patescibacteria group bacterium]
MGDLNKVMLIGNLTKDPEAKTLPSGQSLSNFSLATNRTWKDKDGSKKEQAEFHNIIAWGKLAEICNQYLKKGAKVYIEGRLQTRSWDDQNGVKKYRTEIIAENLSMLSSRGTSTSTGSGSSKPQSQDEELPIIQADEEEINIEDIPF